MQSGASFFGAHAEVEQDQSHLAVGPIFEVVRYMNELVGARSHYKKVKWLGEGATGTVFEALKIDPTYETSQRVAIKVLKSKNHVQLLRNEFLKLQQIQSRFCVKLLGWETFDSGAGLVLELLKGFNLFELCQIQPFESREINEVLGQVQAGLEDLSRQGLYHGDLSLKNIFLTKDGSIKLIDFGSEHSEGKTFANPIYLAPELKSTFKPDFKSDLYALGVIEQQLRTGRLLTEVIDISTIPAPEGTLLDPDPSSRRHQPKKSSQRGRAWLASMVAKEQSRRDMVQKTQQICPSLEVRKPLNMKRKLIIFLPALVFSVFILMIPEHEGGRAKMVSLDLRVSRWAKFSINNLPEQYAPIYIDKLRQGSYKIEWHGAGNEGVHQAQLKDEPLFLLQLDPTPLL